MTADEEARVAGYNVVIHEFAHKLDMRNGEPERLPAAARGHGCRASGSARSRRPTRISAPRSMRPSAARRRRMQAALDALPIDPYAAESAAEFFAVASEAFFETPELLDARVSGGLRAAQGLLPPGPGGAAGPCGLAGTLEEEDGGEDGDREDDQDPLAVPALQVAGVVQDDRGDCEHVEGS